MNPTTITHKSISGRNFILLCGSFVVVFSVLEITCRLFFAPSMPNCIPRLFIANNEAFPWCQPKKYSRTVVNKKTGGSEFVMLVPNLHFAHEYPDNRRAYLNNKNRIPYRSNNYGFRGRDLFFGDAVKDTSRRQIVLLGDSYTFGEGVFLEDTYGSILESTLNLAFPHIPSDVVNFGQPGLNTYTEYIVWNMHSPLVTPDLVIVAFNPCDVVLDKIQEQEKCIITGTFLKMFEKPLGMEAILSKSKLFDFLKFRIMNKYMERKIEKITVACLNKETDGKNPASVCRDNFNMLFKAVQAKGSRFMVILIPSFLKLEEDYPYRAVHNLVADIGQKEGFAVIDLLPLFEGKESSQFWVHSVDHHPNEIAHRMIAEYICSHTTFKGMIRNMYGSAKQDR